VWQSPFGRGCLERVLESSADGMRSLGAP